MEPLFTTERLSIRKFHPEDYNDLADIIADPEVTYFEPYPTFTREACIQEAMNLSENDDFFAVILNQKVIGKIYFSKKGAGTYELGYTFNSSYQGKGYACESIRGFMSYAFENLGARRIIAEIDTRNSRSYRLAERLGMRREAEHKELFPRKENKDIFNDFYIYAILKKEFNS
ncbi:MAG: GNAT family N-acetyltransferase [Ruminococcus sp.]|nr:GNAT family N-acetyltransferase [Ruminococcus sp.]